MTTETPVVEETQVEADLARGPGDWAKKNLFNTWYNTLLTILLSGVFGWALVGLIRGLFSTDFEIIRVNLTLFMVGLFPQDELWRPWLATFLIAVLIGLMAGSIAAGARGRAEEAATTHPGERARP